MVETSKKTNAPASATGNSSNSTFYVTDYDAKLEIENWMTDNNSYRADFIQPAAKDENLQVEDWMLGDQIFEIANETENPLTLENWMIISKTWEN